MRAIPASMDESAVAGIDARLSGIASEHAVAIPLAIESGSRAWGFPSPDSDYDCRFFFVRRAESYLSLWPRPDVIETPLEGDLDVNGWDLRKALQLLVKGNATVIEWLTSPIVYRGVPAFRSELLALAHDIADRNLVARHYLHLGERQRRAYFSDGRQVPLKKIFYALRPAAALRWLRLHPEQAVAPMHFPTLMEECEPPQEVASIVEALMARKAVTRELGSEPLPIAVTAFIDGEFAGAGEAFAGTEKGDAHEKRSRADAFFLGALRLYAPERA
ncbi:MAG: DNA polymerase beta superfamily protein [Rhodomicrobiaceae bacterium]